MSARASRRSSSMPSRIRVMTINESWNIAPPSADRRRRASRSRGVDPLWLHAELPHLLRVPALDRIAACEVRALGIPQVVRAAAHLERRNHHARLVAPPIAQE